MHVRNTKYRGEGLICETHKGMRLSANNRDGRCSGIQHTSQYSVGVVKLSVN